MHVIAWPKRRVILVAGKGGVGRSTAAIAIAGAFADAGHRTLLLEGTVGAPGPSAFEAMLSQPPRPEPQEFGANLFHARLEPRMGQELFLREVVPIGPLVHAALHSRALARLLDASPALDELGVMHHFLTLAERRTGTSLTFDRIVLDLPATGHAIALAELPNTILRIAPHGPIADRLRRGQALLHDPLQTGAIVVTIPEPLAIREAADHAAGLEHAHVPIAAFLVNRAPVSEEKSEAKSTLAAVFGDAEILGRRTLEERLVAAARIDELRATVAPTPVLLASDAFGDATAAVAAVKQALGIRPESRP